jgi:hypothetical protein
MHGAVFSKPGMSEITDFLHSDNISIQPRHVGMDRVDLPCLLRWAGIRTLAGKPLKIPERNRNAPRTSRGQAGRLENGHGLFCANNPAARMQ